MPTETLGFNDKEMRDEQYRRWKAEGSFGLARYSAHQENNHQIVYVVTRAEPVVQSCLQTDIRPEVMEIARDIMKERRDLLDKLGEENDGQDSVHDDLGSGGRKSSPVYESGSPAEGDTQRPDSPDFRDWSA